MTGIALLLFLLAQDDTVVLIRKIAESGRVLQVGVTPSERVSPTLQIAPGAPPLVSFRLMEGKLRHRFGNLDLVLDDAGH
jgi:hypothetical protein